MQDIKPDPFWDSGNSGVRCSSNGLAATQYHDPSNHFLELNGKPISSVMRTGFNGVRGVVIPRASITGGSLGFDAHKPALVNIDPDIKGQSSVIDLRTITKEKMNAAMQEARKNPNVLNDIRLFAAQTYKNLSISDTPIGINVIASPLDANRHNPVNNLGYVVPKSRLGGGQESMPLRPIPVTNPISPSVTPRNFQIPAPPSNEVQSNSMPDEQTYISEQPIMTQRFEDQTPVDKKRNSSTAQVEANYNVYQPAIKVIFETEGWGTFEANYHEVIRNDCLLVLVYNNKFKGGMKFFPPASDKLIAVEIMDSDKIFFVHSYDNRFQHKDCEYCILIIEQISEKED